MIPIFDGHNDTITRDDAACFVTGRAGGHIDLPRARRGGLAGAIFAIFTATPGYDPGFGAAQDGGPYELTLAEAIGPDVAAPAATPAAGRLLALERAGHLRVARRAADLDEDGRDDADTPLATVIAHARHVAERIGAAHVALGSDFDGATMPAELGDAAGLPRLLDALRAGGFSDAGARDRPGELAPRARGAWGG